LSAIATSADGEYIFLALENASGFPVFVRAARADLSTWTSVYAPGVGTAANVASVPGNADLMLFFGYFGSGVQVLSHVVSTGAETNISPAGLTTKVVNCLAVNPSDPDEIIITVNTDQDLLRTIDGGDNWETLNASLTFNATGLAVAWGGPSTSSGQGDGEPHGIYVAGNDGVDTFLLYSPNDGLVLGEVTGAALTAVANVVGVEVA
jgi:hypothetical protein